MISRVSRVAHSTLFLSKMLSMEVKAYVLYKAIDLRNAKSSAKKNKKKSDKTIEIMLTVRILKTS